MPSGVNLLEKQDLGCYHCVNCWTVPASGMP